MYYCKKCNTPVPENSNFCMNCGAPVEAEAAPAAPTPAAPASPLTENATVASIKKYMHFIIAGLAGLALIVGILNLFGLYDATAVAKFGGFKNTASGPVTDLYEDKPIVLFANMIYGLVSLLIAFIGASHFLKTTMNNDLYDKYVAKHTQKLVGKYVAGDGVLTLMGVLGAANVLLQWLLYLFTLETQFGASASVRIHFTGWIMLVVYLGVAACDLFWLNKKQK